ADLKTKLTHITALAKRAEGHLPESSRGELADLSVSFEELERTVDHVLNRISEAVTAISDLEQQAEARFEAVRQLVDGDNCRRLEPQVADHLRRYSHRTGGSERVTLQARLAERIGVVEGEIENQIRDQNACLEQLRLHVIHADDLVARAVRCSKIPEHVP